jgi:hypothetical protein
MNSVKSGKDKQIVKLSEVSLPMQEVGMHERYSYVEEINSVH